MKTILNIKTDREVKVEAQKIAKDIGVSLSSVMNAYLKQFVRNREAYFTLSPRMLPEFETLIGTVESDIRRNKNLSREFSSVKEMEKYLNIL